ncbi:hypothetical protein ACHAWO_010697 [Cyclotella atomus]|jgi:hypothetical protein|uniref:Uncharacterized protein n=1 Tax=Cyclotella atomus TaxID=382360 RepID=A0ABD3PHM8_9STRA
MMHLVILSALVFKVTSFSSVSSPRTATHAFDSRLLASKDSEGRGLKRGQEMKMEMSSLAGAKAIARLSINERTKRAMLAEVVEDRIFEITEEIELIVTRNEGVLEGDQREEAVELAKQTKALQKQYDDLVNGRPSALLVLGDDGNLEEGEEGFQ